MSFRFRRPREHSWTDYDFMPPYRDPYEELERAEAYHNFKKKQWEDAKKAKEEKEKESDKKKKGLTDRQVLLAIMATWPLVGLATALLMLYLSAGVIQQMKHIGNMIK